MSRSTDEPRFESLRLETTPAEASSRIARRLRRHFPFSERSLVLLLGDVLVLVVAVSVTNALAGVLTGVESLPVRIIQPPDWMLIWMAIWLVGSTLNMLYDIPSSYSLGQTVSRVFATALLTMVGLLGLLYPLHYPAPGPVLLAATVLAVPGIIGWRWLYIRLSRLSPFHHRLIIVGTGRRAQSIRDLLAQHPTFDFEVVGYIDEASGQSVNLLGEPGAKHRPWELRQFVRDSRAHEIVLATDEAVTMRLLQQLIQCQAEGVKLTSLVDFFMRLGRRVPIQYIDGHWILSALQGHAVFTPQRQFLKRSFDLLLVLISLPFLALLLPLVALAVRLDSPGPVIYTQVRRGLGGKPFTIIKFRTMRVDAEAAGQPQWAVAADSRITRVGSLLRKARLDELPQLWNVLRGEMSIVGPRPERPEFVTLLAQEIPYFEMRTMVRPGLTGWAQTHSDYGSSVDDANLKLQYDLYYIRHWSPWLDLEILLRTVGVVVRLKGI